MNVVRLEELANILFNAYHIYTMYQAMKVGRRLVRSGSLSSESSDSEEEGGRRMRSIIVQVRKRLCVHQQVVQQGVVKGGHSNTH